MGPPGVVELDSVANDPRGVLLGLEAVTVNTLLLEGTDDPLNHPVLLRAVRQDCHQRAFPPLDRKLVVPVNERRLVPFGLG